VLKKKSGQDQMSGWGQKRTRKIIYTYKSPDLEQQFKPSLPAAGNSP